jgi:hypothetical protein
LGKHLSEVWASLTRWQKVAVVFLLLGSFGYIQARLSDTGKPAASSAHIAAVSGAEPKQSSIERCVATMVGIGMQYYGLGVIEANKQAWAACKADAARVDRTR